MYFKIFLTQQDGKRLAQTASNACECRFLIQEILQLLTPAGMAELAQGFGFDLADPLAGDIKYFAHFLQGAGDRKSTRLNSSHWS